jgi:Na+-driven multidrug efflux pump
VYYIAYGKLGANSLAALQVSMTLTDFSWAIFTGVGSAAAILIGNEIGKSDAQKSYNYSKSVLVLGLIIAFVIGGIMIALSPYLYVVFKLSQETLMVAKYCVIIMALYMPIRNFNYIMFISVLRSGGDTKYCMVVDAMSVWLIGVPLTFLTVNTLPIGIAMLLAVSYTEEIAKAWVVYRRFVSKKWMNNLVS